VMIVLEDRGDTVPFQMRQPVLADRERPRSVDRPLFGQRLGRPIRGKVLLTKRNRWPWRDASVAANHSDCSPATGCVCPESTSTRDK